MRRKINVLLSSLIALLSGCKTLPEPTQSTVVVIYGVPYARYEVSGTVKDNQGKPIENADVILKVHRHRILGDTLQTDKKGSFTTTTTVSGFPPADTLYITTNDPSGEHISDSTKVPIYESGRNAKGFFRGEYTIDTDITLQKK